jgi:hypothetical protein
MAVLVDRDSSVERTRTFTCIKGKVKSTPKS